MTELGNCFIQKTKEELKRAPGVGGTEVSLRTVAALGGAGSFGEISRNSLGLNFEPKVTSKWPVKAGDLRLGA